LRQVPCPVKKKSLLLKNKSKFVSLRRILPILTFILLTTLCSQAQSSRFSTLIDPAQRIMKIYPNPATTYITFDFDKNAEKGYSIQIFSFLGRKMYENQNLASKTTVDLSDFNRGVYIYHLIDRNGKIIESGKFQVSK
jgi:hypothetical protein